MSKKGYKSIVIPESLYEQLVAHALNAKTGRPQAMYSKTLLGRAPSRCSLFFGLTLKPAQPKSYCVISSSKLF